MREEPIARARAWVLYGQVGFVAFLLVCVLLHPSGILMNRGVSYFGDVALTRLPFSLAFLIAAGCFATAATTLPMTPGLRRYAPLLRGHAALLLAIMVSTFSLDPAVITLHVALGILLFVLQIVAGLWFAGWVSPNGPTRAWLAGLVAAGGMALLALLHVLPLLILWQVLFQAAYTALLLRALRATDVRAR